MTRFRVTFLFLFAAYSSGGTLAQVGGSDPIAEQTCEGFVNPVVPGACLGQFRHGTLVKKTGSGSNELLELASGPADATHTHPGVDLVAECGSSIYALADGVVVDAIAEKSDPDFSQLGYMVRLKHAATRTGLPPPAVQLRQAETLYLHMQEPPAVVVGSVVLEHTLLGKVGRTGAAWGCHTHFEVRHFAGRYMTDPNWNAPPNIYGRGDQTASKVFRDNWTDPTSWFANRPAEFSPPTPFPLDPSVKAIVRDLPQLPATYDDPGACPGEHCRYGAWTIPQGTPVHATRGASTTTFMLAKGQKVTALTGVVSTRPGRIRIIHPVRVGNEQWNPESGDLNVLTYRGEGYWKVWLNGKLIDSIDLNGINFVSVLNCKASDRVCKQKRESRWIGPIVGEVETEPDPKWWVQIRDSAGRTGWIEVPSPTWSSINGYF